MIIQDIMQAMEEIAPAHLAASWDNSGFAIGNPNQTVEKILLTIDVTPETIAEAMAEKCQLIISHHPLLFHPCKNIITTQGTGQLIQQLLKEDIALFSAHTNLDHAAQGVNHALAAALGLTNIQAISDDNENPTFMGKFPKPITGEQLITIIKTTLNISHFSAVALDLQKAYQKIAVCGGAGADLWQDAQQSGADCLITAEGKHHIGLDAQQAGFCLIDAGHYDTEKLVLPALKSFLEKKLPQSTILISQINTNPWKLY